MRWWTVLVFVVALAWPREASAFSGCNEACAVAAYAAITVGGVVTAAGSQVMILKGEPDENWGTASLSLAAANGAFAGGILIASGIMAALDDRDAKWVALWGGIQMGVAVAGLVSGAHVVANQDPDKPRPPPGVSMRWEF